MRVSSALLSPLIAAALLAQSHGYTQTLRLVPPTQKLLPDDEVPPGAEPLELYAARNESEAFQAVVTAGEAPVSVAAVTCSPLRAEEGDARIRVRDIELHLVGYLDVTEPSWRGPKMAGLWPDPLVPLRPVEVPAGQNRIVWVRINVPRNAGAGWYHGSVTSRLADGAALTRNFRLKVWDFALTDETHLRTSFWFNSGAGARGALFGTEPQGLDHWKPWFDAYARERLSTDVWIGEEQPVKWFREADGSITVDCAVLQEFIRYSVERCHCSIINVGTGCWGSSFLSLPIIDRETGEALPKEEHGALRDRMYAAYLNHICDWLDERGWLDKAYIQLWDEPKRDTWDWGVRTAYSQLKEVEPRLKRLCVVGVHPYLQGFIDIWVPQTHFYDRETYADVAAGVPLCREKAVPAKVSASSTGGWGNAAFYTYQPIDAHDGCDYTKWTPAEPATPDKPQWLRFDFEAPQRLKGLRILPYQSEQYEADKVRLSIEVSEDGEQFSAVDLASAPGVEGGYDLPAGDYRAVRLMWSSDSARFVPTDGQPLPPPETSALGVREVWFEAEGASSHVGPEKKAFPPVEMWEYNVGADFPSFTVDSPAQEQRCLPWLCWQRDIKGFLYYGTTLWLDAWDEAQIAQFVAEPPLVWLGAKPGNNGGSFCFYPGANGPLPSIRTELWREGLEDYEYLWLAQGIAERQPGSAMAALVDPERVRGLDIRDAGQLLRYRQELGEALSAAARAGE